MEKIVVYKQPTGVMTEAYRTMCTNVLVALGEKKILEVAGVAENNNSVSIVTANLAIAMAQAGKNVLLVDCNLRNPKQHELFGLQSNGLTDCILLGGNYETFVHQMAQDNLFVLAAGKPVTNPVETLLSANMQSILYAAKGTYDVILLDMPPVGTLADTVALGTKTDGVLLVLANKKDKVEQAQKAKDVLIQAGVAILGCVLDKVGVS